MTSPPFTASASGVLVANDFRENLIIDRFDPIFGTMRASKIKHIRSENSEDAITWNVFRSLRQIHPQHWLPDLVSQRLPGVAPPFDSSVIVELWRSVPPPLGLLETGDEGASEIDVIIECPKWVWFIEAKYHSDISTGTTTRPTRDQVLRNIDVGSYYAGVRDFHFSLLIRSPERSPRGVETVAGYQDFKSVRAQLPHRPDGLANLRSVGMLTWSDVGRVLERAQNAAVRGEERQCAERANSWLRAKGLLDN